MKPLLAASGAVGMLLRTLVLETRQFDSRYLNLPDS